MSGSNISEQLSSAFLQNKALVAATALLYYDWALMLPVESTEIWMQGFSAATTLYLTTRYFNLGFWAVTLLLTFIPGSPLTCSALFYLSVSLTYVGIIPLKAVFILHTWAIYRKSNIVLCVLCTIVLVSLIADLSLFWEQTIAYSPSPSSLVGGCEEGAKHSIRRWYPAVIFGSLIFDLVVLLFTFVKMRKAWLSIDGIHFYRSIQVLRDGTLYLSALALPDIVNGVLYYAFPNSVVLDGFLNSFVSVLQVSLVCRMVLNLRRLLHRHMQSEDQNAYVPPEDVIHFAVVPFSVQNTRGNYYELEAGGDS